MRHWKSLYGADIIDVNYDAYVHDTETEARKLFASLGLDWQRANASAGRCRENCQRMAGARTDLSTLIRTGAALRAAVERPARRVGRGLVPVYVGEVLRARVHQAAAGRQDIAGVNRQILEIDVE